MSMAEEFLNPNGRPIYLTPTANGWSKCSGCREDIALCTQLEERRQSIIQALGDLCHRPPVGRGGLYVSPRDVEVASRRLGVIGAVDDYDEIHEVLEENRSACSGAEEFVKDGTDYIYCPRLDIEFPRVQREPVPSQEGTT